MLKLLPLLCSQSSGVHNSNIVRSLKPYYDFGFWIKERNLLNIKFTSSNLKSKINLAERVGFEPTEPF